MLGRTFYKNNRNRKSINDILNGLVTSGTFYFSNLNNSMYFNKRNYDKKYPIN